LPLELYSIREKASIEDIDYNLIKPVLTKSHVNAENILLSSLFTDKFRATGELLLGEQGTEIQHGKVYIL